MLKKEIKVGRKYIARVRGAMKVVTVKDISARPGTRYMKGGTVYTVLNHDTGRECTFRSATKFVREVADEDAQTSDAWVVCECGNKYPKHRTRCPKCKVYQDAVQAKPANTHRKHSAAAEALAKRKATVDRSPHVIVVARAGTGKTFTLVEGLRRLKGCPTPGVTPSPQQAAVWEALEQSRGNDASVCFVAFNKSIATELQAKVPAGCDAMTLHSLGYKAVMRAFGRVNVNSYRVQDIIAELLERDIREIRRRQPNLITATEKLVALCKQNLVSTSLEESHEETSIVAWEEELDKLAAYYDVDLNGDREKVFQLVPQVLDRCRDVKADGKIDFNDMIWLPVALGLNVNRYDLLLVDEAQDLNRCQQQLALKAGRRLVLCGDPKQAIYGFAGADAESMNRMQSHLGATERGVVVLPLTVTRRCGKAIVVEAQQIVPDFEAYEANGEGRISKAIYSAPETMDGLADRVLEDPNNTYAAPSYTAMVEDGDFILCRVNAPLVSQCFRFLKAGRKANIQGRDIGQGLISTIRKLKAATLPELMERLSDWHHNECQKESRKRNPNDARLIALQDRYECLQVFCEDAQSVEGVVERIESVFTDSNTTGIRLSSVHKAKGLEAKRVFILLPQGAGMPHPMAKSAWQRDQEMNLKYVAITRAIEELIYVS